LDLVSYTAGPGITRSEGSYDLFPTSFFKSITAVQNTVKECSTNKNDSIFNISDGRVNGTKLFSLESEEHVIPYPKQQPSPISDHSKSPVEKSNNIVSHVISNESEFISLSPVSSVKSNNSSNVTPSQNNTTTLSAISSASNEEIDLEGDGSEPGKVYECEFCDAKFRIRGYLTRHMKKHSSKKAYHCPFHDSNSSSKCHATGGFSRRDTFKTHLKARHFKYPPGVKSAKRTGMVGWCGICGERVLNNEIWVERHIEGGKCPGLPKSYLENLNPGRKKTGKHSKFLDVENVKQSLILGDSKRDVNEFLSKMVSPTLTATNTPSPNVPISYGFDQTPLPIQSQISHEIQPSIEFQNNDESSNKTPFLFTNKSHIPPSQQFIQSQTIKKDPEVAMLIERKMLLQQYISALQKAATIPDPQNQYPTPQQFTPEPAMNFNQNCFHPLNGEEEEDYPSLDSEYSPAVLKNIASMTSYPVNSFQNLQSDNFSYNGNYGVSLEES